MIFELQWRPQTNRSAACVEVYGAHSNGKYLIGTIEQNALSLDNFWHHYQEARKRFARLTINTFEPDGLHEERIAIVLDTGILQKAGVHENTKLSFKTLKEFGFDMIKQYITSPAHTPHIAPQFKVA